jgi:hypothetical protein
MNDSRESDPRLAPIRRLHEQAERYHSVSGTVSLLAGALSIAASTFLLWKLKTSESRAIDPDLFFGTWILVLLITVGTAFTLLRRSDSGRKTVVSPMISHTARFAVETVLPHAITAVALGLLLSSRGSAFSLSIVWVTLYGLALCSTRPFAPGSLVTLGNAFLITGISLMLFVYLRIKFLIGYERNDYHTLMIMGLTFGLYHLIYAIASWPKTKRAR